MYVMGERKQFNALYGNNTMRIITSSQYISIDCSMSRESFLNLKNKHSVCSVPNMCTIGGDLV